MGMFDDLRCEYPLPLRDGVTRNFQTKSLDCMMDRYEIRADGTLWREVYEIKYQSDPTATGGYRLPRVSAGWEPITMTGEVRFYAPEEHDQWIEFSTYFVKGMLKHLETIELPDHLRTDDEPHNES